MPNENKGENLPNQETDGQMIKRLREERNTYKAQKSHWKKKAEVKPDDKSGKPKAPKSDDSDYATKLAVKAFLNSKDVKHTDDQEYIMKEAKLMNRNPDEILEMEHVKSHLKGAKDTRETQEGMPKGGGKGGGNASDSVEYWVAKGKLSGDQALDEKIVEAKLKSESNKNTFSDTMFVD